MNGEYDYRTLPETDCFAKNFPFRLSWFMHYSIMKKPLIHNQSWGFAFIRERAASRATILMAAPNDK